MSQFTELDEFKKQIEYLSRANENAKKVIFTGNPCSEDEKDISKVNFDIKLFETYTKGYLKSLGNSITKIEKENLVLGAIMMTYECGMRFLADYLDGDVYFHRKREGQNLDRARTQFKLVLDMESNLDKMNEIIKKQ